MQPLADRPVSWMLKDCMGIQRLVRNNLELVTPIYKVKARFIADDFIKNRKREHILAISQIQLRDNQKELSRFSSNQIKQNRLTDEVRNEYSIEAVQGSGGNEIEAAIAVRQDRHAQTHRAPNGEE